MAEIPMYEWLLIWGSRQQFYLGPERHVFLTSPRHDNWRLTDNGPFVATVLRDLLGRRILGFHEMLAITRKQVIYHVLHFTSGGNGNRYCSRLCWAETEVHSLPNSVL